MRCLLDDRGSSILELLSEEGLEGVKVVRMGVPDSFVEHGTREELLADLGLTADGIIDRVLAMLDGDTASKPRRLAFVRGARADAGAVGPTS